MLDLLIDELEPLDRDEQRIWATVYYMAYLHSCGKAFKWENTDWNSGLYTCTLKDGHRGKCGWWATDNDFRMAE